MGGSHACPPINIAFSYAPTNSDDKPGPPVAVTHQGLLICSFAAPAATAATARAAIMMPAAWPPANNTRPNACAPTRPALCARRQLANREGQNSSLIVDLASALCRLSRPSSRPPSRRKPIQQLAKRTRSQGLIDEQKPARGSLRAKPIWTSNHEVKNTRTGASSLASHAHTHLLASGALELNPGSWSWRSQVGAPAGGL